MNYEHRAFFFLFLIFVVILASAKNHIFYNYFLIYETRINIIYFFQIVIHSMCNPIFQFLSFQLLLDAYKFCLENSKVDQSYKVIRVIILHIFFCF